MEYPACIPVPVNFDEDLRMAETNIKAANTQAKVIAILLNFILVTGSAAGFYYLLNKYYEPVEAAPECDMAFDSFNNILSTLNSIYQDVRSLTHCQDRLAEHNALETANMQISGLIAMCSAMGIVATTQFQYIESKIKALMLKVKQTGCVISGGRMSKRKTVRSTRMSKRKATRMSKRKATRMSKRKATRMSKRKTTRMSKRRSTRMSKRKTY
jgi:hypothetical protein